jgi:hypothetical protein
VEKRELVNQAVLAKNYSTLSLKSYVPFEECPADTIETLDNIARLIAAD